LNWCITFASCDVVGVPTRSIWPFNHLGRAMGTDFHPHRQHASAPRYDEILVAFLPRSISSPVMSVLRFLWQRVLAFDRIGSRIPQLIHASMP
jgi:hypothetical protein